ncbi:MAG TPA: 16S rRNA (adenine(1518)-N(6)/adenine(1519)-N(6))-dimethyltransferase RsmA [Vicinamibacterales bacterium]|nr:16S rRNA (adenine(1518)-N(6)/adenine(1519)-N(6))-dimethyltransferase RsmA [Vicinamibacterales bacterium]
MRGAAKKRYGQHFLEAAWAGKLVDAIDPATTDNFLEIGPGQGALTLRLAPRVAHVTAVEVDADMVAALIPKLPPNVTLLHQDFLDLDVRSLPRIEQGVRVAGNLPYNVTSPILFKLLAARRDGIRLADATLMVQLEVAERIESSPGTKEYGTLSIFVQLRARVRRLLTLPPGAFRPSPKVHSAVLRLDFHDLEIPIRDEPTFEALVRSIFTQRRKTLANALRRFADERGVDARAAIARAAIDGVRRPETLQLTELARLADVFSS